MKITAEITESLQRLRGDRDFETFVGLLRAELEDAKASLVRAHSDEVPVLQGRAQALDDLIREVDRKPASAPAPRGNAY